MVLLALSCTENQLIVDEDVPEPGPDEGSEGTPDVQVSPTDVVFPETVPGEMRSEVVRVDNVGDAELKLIGLELDSESFSVSALPGPLLGIGEGFELVVDFTPWDYGEVEGVLVIETNDPDSPQVEVPLQGGTLEPALEIAPDHHDFGTLQVGQSAEAEFVVTNMGGAPAELVASYAGSSAELSADLPGPDAVGAGESVSFWVTYAPTDETPDEGTLTVTPDFGWEVAASQVGNGEDPVTDYEIEMRLTADDAWQGWIDGSDLAGGFESGWSSSSSFSTTLQSGAHVLAVHATDQAQVIAGFIGVVSVDGVPTYVTGDGSWVMTPSAPSSGWTDVAFDDSAWSTPPVCSDTSPWGSAPTDITGTGAQWIWHSSNCRALGEAWFRLEMVLP